MNLVFVGLFLVTADGTLWASLDIHLAPEGNRFVLLGPKISTFLVRPTSETCRPHAERPPDVDSRRSSQRKP